jgi:hypothetical protein
MSLNDIGSAYSRKPPAYNAKLTEVGRGTPMGELLRRYWHPVGMTGDAGAGEGAGRGADPVS